MRRLCGLRGGGRLVLALAVGGSVFGIATVVQASIPDANGVIHACYHVNGQGQVDGGANLRVIDPASSNKDGSACKKDETALNWNQTGPTGPPGPPGKPGTPGTPGPPGSVSLATLQGSPCTVGVGGPASTVSVNIDPVSGAVSLVCTPPKPPPPPPPPPPTATLKLTNDEYSQGTVTFFGILYGSGLMPNSTVSFFGFPGDVPLTTGKGTADGSGNINGVDAFILCPTGFTSVQATATGADGKTVSAPTIPTPQIPSPC